MNFDFGLKIPVNFKHPNPSDSMFNLYITIFQWITVDQLVECWTGDLRVASSNLTASHCVVFLSKALYPLLNTGSTCPDMTGKLLTGDLRIKRKQIFRLIKILFMIQLLIL